MPILGNLPSSGGGITLTDLSSTANTAANVSALSYNSSTGVFSYTPVSIEALGNIGNVSTTAATAGQVLTWNGTSSAWEPATPAAGGGGSTSTLDSDGLGYTRGTDATYPSFTIGKNSPTDQAAVLGTVLVHAGNSGQSGILNTGMGTGAMCVATSGERNTMIGGLAGCAVTTGSCNTLIGSTAGSSNSGGGTASITGSENVLVGQATATRTNTSSCVTAVGSTAAGTAGASSLGYAAHAMGTGSVAIGCCANVDTSSAGSIAIGCAAGVTGNAPNGIAIGAGSRALGASLNPSMAIGTAALACCINSTVIGNSAQSTAACRATLVGGGATVNGTAHDSVAIGYLAQSNGAASVAIGNDVHAGQQSVIIGSSNAGTRVAGNQGTGTANTIIGAAAGCSLTTGSSNVFIGLQAGRNITTGSANIVIGSTATASATGNNVIQIGLPTHTTVEIGDGGVAAVSDERDKKDITAMASARDFIDAIEPSTWIWDPRDKEVDSRTHKDTGVIAQQVLKAQKDTGFEVPGLVNDDNEDRLTVVYARFIAPLIKASQELSAEVEALKAEIVTLKNK